MNQSRDIVSELANALHTGEASPALSHALREISAKVFTALKRRFQEADVEDGIAEVFFLLATQPDLFREQDGSLEGFVYIVARNIVARRLRQLSRQMPTDPQRLVEQAHTFTDDSTVETPDTNHAAVVPTVNLRRRKALARKLKSLDRVQREILMEFASAQQGEPWATRYARRTGDDPNRVRVCLHRLLAKLRKELAIEMKTAIGSEESSGTSET
jgi:DNA-directed RNA polymerase specialized sigma24 family protein